MIWKNLSLLRGIAMVLVVLNHAVRLSSSLQRDEYDHALSWNSGFGTTLRFVLLNVTPLCIAAFLVASGFTAYKFMRSWRAAHTAAVQVLRRYLLWALPLLLLIALKDGSWDPHRTLLGILRGAPMSSYWFLVAIAELYLVSPLLVRCVERRPRTTLSAVIALQACVCTVFYANLTGATHLHAFPTSRALYVLPYFVGGMLLARNAPAVATLLGRYAGVLFTLSGAALIAVFGESLWLATRPGDSSGAMFAGERISQVVFGALVVSIMLIRPAPDLALTRWLNRVGIASFGILLAGDLCQRVVYVALWHIPGRIIPATPLQAVAGMPPAWMSYGCLGLFIVLFMTGVMGPIILMRLAQRVGGDRFCRFVFGTLPESRRARPASMDRARSFANDSMCPPLATHGGGRSVGMPTGGARRKWIDVRSAEGSAG